MIVAAHQPNYLPWLGYFYKIGHCDVFVLLDDVQFTKNSYENRTRVKGPKGPFWLTQPVLHAGRAAQATSEVEFDCRVAWRAKHLKTLTANYGRSTHAVSILRACEEWLADDSLHLSGTNIAIIEAVARLLGLKAEFVLSSTLNVELKKGDRIAEICRRLGATAYLSGHGARSYQNEALFNERGIELLYSDFAVRQYPQLWGEFCPGLSIIDALFNLGVDVTADMLRNG
jgi:WbqC-like protein family